MARQSEGYLYIWHLSALEAAAGSFGCIHPAHFFLALCKACDLPVGRVPAGVPEHLTLRMPLIEREVAEVGRIFRDNGLDIRQFRYALRAILGRPEEPVAETLHRSPEARALCDLADRLCSLSGAQSTRPLHLLIALMRCEGWTEAPWIALLDEMGVSQGDLLLQAQAAAENVMPEIVRTKIAVCSKVNSNSTPLLDQYGRDITRLAKEGSLSPTIGRKSEMRRLGRVLLRQTKNNAILIGDAGVGKTCIVEGFASLLAQSELPEFQGRRIIEISLGALVAGTQYRGEFEQRVMGILEEARHPEIILFIDEIHMMVGAGAPVGGMDAANLLKPALARGELRCIGATTLIEYRRHIEGDAALDRRFEPVVIHEPTAEETREILIGIRSVLEQHHRVAIPDAAIQAAIDLSMRYAAQARFPDKAYTLLDDACSMARFRSFGDRSESSSVDPKDVSDAASERYGVPIQELSQDQASRLLNMEVWLRQRIKGQDEAIATLAQSVRSAHTGFRAQDCPLGVFLFVGPSGTGKTALAKALAEYLCQDPNQLICIDMSEYGEPHSRSKLTGAPPGYVGYEDEPALLLRIRNQPYSVVLLDEIEKAHPEVLQVFLQVFAEGRLTDHKGRTASFRESIVIMTSNLGALKDSAHERRLGIIQHSCPAEPALDLTRLHEDMLNAVKGTMSEAFRNRIQRLIYFDPLTREALREIVDQIINEYSAPIRARSIRMDVAESAYDLLIANGYKPAYGAREMKRACERLLFDRMSPLLLAGAFENGARLRIVAEAGELRFEPD